MIVQINYLAGTNIPDNIFAIRQCASYIIYTKQPHEESVKRIGRYLKKKSDKGLVFTPNGSNGKKCYADAFYLDHCVENMQIKLGQFCQEPDTLSNSQIYQSFG